MRAARAARVARAARAARAAKVETVETVATGEGGDVLTGDGGPNNTQNPTCQKPMALAVSLLTPFPFA